jgi:hypothetical protein
MRYPDAPHTEGEGWRAVVAAVDNLRDEIGTRHVENTSNLELMQKELKVAIDRIDDLSKGFPDGDPDGHRRAHEAQIRKAEARTRLYEKLYEELATKGILALLAFVGSAVIYYAAAKLHIGGK